MVSQVAHMEVTSSGAVTKAELVKVLARLGEESSSYIENIFERLDQVDRYRKVDTSSTCEAVIVINRHTSGVVVAE